MAESALGLTNVDVGTLSELEYNNLSDSPSAAASM